MKRALTRRDFLKASGCAFLGAYALGVTGCQQEQSGTQGGQGGTVRMVQWPGPEGEAMQKVVDTYNTGPGQEEGVNVEMILLSRTDTFAKEQTMMSSKSSEVDVYFTASYILGQHAPYVDSLEDALGDSLDSYLPSAAESLQVEGETLAIPTDVSNHFLYYRTDLIDKLMNDSSWGDKYRSVSQEIVGKTLSPKAPEEWSWEDFLAAAAFFTEKYNSDSPTQYGTALQLKNLIFNVMIWNDVLWSYGGSWLDESGEPALTSEAASKSMDVYVTAYEKGLTSPNSTSWEFPETQEALKTGSAAFAVQWSAAFSELDDPERSPEVAGKIGIAPVPGEEHQTHIHNLALALNKYSENKEAALAWLKYLTTQDAMKIYAENGGIPPLPDVLNGMSESRPVLPVISEHVKKYGFTLPIQPETQQMLEALSSDLSAAWVGEKDPNKALEEAQSSLESILS